MPLPPEFGRRDYGAPSVFTAENLLREARRQKGIAEGAIPALGVLDPDGDIVRHLTATGAAAPEPAWACYHSTMHRFEIDGTAIGIVGCAVGAPYAVLVAEQMFASGCRLLVSLTSSGELASLGPRPYFVLVDRALRDEGTSDHYLAPAAYADGDLSLIDRVHRTVRDCGPAIYRGSTWTTDAPFRETRALLDAGRAAGIAAIEMEVAALYTLARVRGFPIACFAHVTNAMAQQTGDFEKGDHGGAVDALAIIGAIARDLPAILGGA